MTPPAVKPPPAEHQRRALRRRLAAVAILLAVCAGSVGLLLHPLVLPGRSNLFEVMWTIQQWQNALHQAVPAEYRRAARVPPQVVAGAREQAVAALRQVGTPAFADGQIVHALPSQQVVVLQSAVDISDVRYLRRYWDGDLLVRAQVRTLVRTAPYRAVTHHVGRAKTARFETRVECRVRDVLGIWRIVSAETVR